MGRTEPSYPFYIMLPLLSVGLHGRNLEGLNSVGGIFKGWGFIHTRHIRNPGWQDTAELDG